MTTTTYLERLRASLDAIMDEGSELADIIRLAIALEEQKQARAYVEPERMPWLQEWSFTVPGTPVAQGSLSYKGMRKTKDGRQIPIIVASNSRELEKWREAVGWAAKAVNIAEAGHLQPVAIECIFRRPRAASNRGTYPIMPPDLDKLLRAIGDALKGIAYHDDAQVVSWHGDKEYGPAQAEVTVRWLGQLL